MIRPIGSEVEEPVDVRIIAATNQKLDEMVREGKFRLDLYYRLNVVEFLIPPLRQRREDIGILATQFLEEFNKRFQTGTTYSREVIEVFKGYSWPGNIRELRHVVESMVVMSTGTVLTVENLPSELLNEVAPSPASYFERGATLKQATAALERAMILDALGKHHTNAATAEVLGLSAAALIRKRQKYDI